MTSAAGLWKLPSTFIQLKYNLVTAAEALLLSPLSFFLFLIDLQITLLCKQNQLWIDV